MGRSKTAHIKFLETTELASIDVLDIKSSDLIGQIRARRKSGAGASTVNNDIVWSRVIPRYARAAWEVPFDLTRRFHWDQCFSSLDQLPATA